MNIEEYRNYCVSKKGVTEEFPFDNNTLVFKVMGKMFALADIDYFESINLKCDPEKAIELRLSWAAVFPAYHMNKKHWNTIINDGSIPVDTIFKWIDHSYELVSAGLSKRQRQILERL